MGNKNIYYFDVIPPEYKKTLICIHGAGGYAHHWGNQLRKAVDWNCRIIAVDLPGHGKSGGKPLRSINNYKHFIEQFLAQLQIVNYGVIGHSMGGAIALDMALNSLLPPKKIILIGTSPTFRVNTEILNEFKKGLKPDRFIKAAYSKTTPIDFLNVALKEFAATPAQTYFYDLLACKNFDVTEIIKTLSIPSFWLFGDLDRLVSNKEVISTISHITSCQYKIIETAGHMLHLEQAEIINNEIYNFLSSTN